MSFSLLLFCWSKLCYYLFNKKNYIKMYIPPVLIVTDNDKNAFAGITHIMRIPGIKNLIGRNIFKVTRA